MSECIDCTTEGNDQNPLKEFAHPNRETVFICAECCDLGGTPVSPEVAE